MSPSEPLLPLVDPRQDALALLEDAIARIGSHTPDWTHHGPSDPGIALLELFAFMTESIVYRAQQIPERNRRLFLSLLGVPPTGAMPATGLVTFSTRPQDGAALAVVDRGTRCYAGDTVFTMGSGTPVLPITAAVYIKTEVADEAAEDDGATIYEVLGGPSPPANPLYHKAELVELGDGSGRRVRFQDTTDDSIWIALLVSASKTVASDVEKATVTLARGAQLTLGAVHEQLDEVPLAAVPRPKARSTGLRYDVVVVRDGAIEYDRLGADLLDGGPPDVVGLTFPTDFDEVRFDPATRGPLTGDSPPVVESAVEDRLVAWIRMRVAEEWENEPAVDFLWLGVNAAPAKQLERQPRRLVASGTGRPDQVVTIGDGLVFGSVEVDVDGEQWQEIDDLGAAAAELTTVATWRGAQETGAGAPRSSPNRFVVDHEAGEIRFGNGIRGARPAKGAPIAVSYARGGGRAGNVPAKAIKTADALPPGVRVENPLAMTGGQDRPTIEDRERAVVGYLKHRERLVTEQDFRDIALATPGADIGRVEVLATVRPAIADVPSAGAVTVLVVPRNDPTHPDFPFPSESIRQAVFAHLHPKRLVTTELYVIGPRYVDLRLSAGIEVEPGRSVAAVEKNVRAELRRHLGALTGGFAESDADRGWPLGRTVTTKELETVVARVPGVIAVLGVRMSERSVERDERELGPLDLPRVTSVEVSQTDAPSPLPRPGRTDGAAARGVPVIDPPERC